MKLYNKIQTISLLALMIMAVNPAISAQIEKQQIVLFPFAVSSDVDAAKVEYTTLYAEDLFTLVNDGLTASKRFLVFKYSPRIASIQRAVKEQKTTTDEVTSDTSSSGTVKAQVFTFTEDEVKKPIDTSYSGTKKAQKLAEIIGISCAVTGSIDKYEFLEEKGEAQVTVTLQFIDTASGKVKSAFTTTGRAVRNPDKRNQSEIVVGISATQDAAKKLLSDIGAAKSEELFIAKAATTDKNTIQPSGHKKKGLLPAMIVAGILGFILSGG